MNPLSGSSSLGEHKKTEQSADLIMSWKYISSDSSSSAHICWDMMFFYNELTGEIWFFDELVLFLQNMQLYYTIWLLRREVGLT